MIFPVDLTDNYLPILTCEYECLYVQLQPVNSSSSHLTDILWYHIMFTRLGKK